ncbi:MAG TPA: TonB-dependent siderophore receptor [Albitalea sp.]|uniref:TonB-dependent siderophore receptor n=1 Tax=Piscinibacter sp. TaxID=1903157 RepID=UPI002ED2165D
MKPASSFLVLLLATLGVHAQTTTTLSPVTVTGKGEPAATIGGWGDVPLSQSPFQASVLGREQMRELGVSRLSDVGRVDPAVSDAYDTEGYWDYLTVRGFVIDNRFNYRRDGLPINAETSIPLDNKERIEVLKGTSGLQAGTSAPGGLVNLVVKRPVNDRLREVQLGWRQSGSLLGAVDIAERFGTDGAFGVRLNVAAEQLKPRVRSAEGDRRLLALAGEWRIATGMLLEAELETSHRSQPSVPGFSMLGQRVPAPVDPRINLNNQPWSLPVVLDGDTASVRFTQSLGTDWRWSAHAATQRLKSDDRIAFPFGCSAEGNFDRYCSDGSVDLYDFRSENERRRTDALELALHGTVRTGGLRHAMSAAVLRSQVRNRFQGQAFNFAGTGNVDGTAVVPAAPALTDENTNRDERSTELSLRDAVTLREGVTAWLGLRHTRLHRESVRTDGSQATSFDQSISTPSIALSVVLAPDTLAYASWGRGVESVVVPNRDRYTNRGEALPAAKSRQAEAGIKASSGDWNWGAAAFDIVRPVAADVGIDCFSDAVPDTCTHQADGSARHRGVELSASWQAAPWALQGGVQWLRARREGSVRPEINGQRPTNVPAAALKLQGRYDVAALPGLALQGDLLAEGDRMVLEDNSARIPGYARVDASLRYAQATGLGRLTWRAGVDNLFNRRAWRESPLQFGHVYLFPLAPRTWRLSVEVAL